MQSSVMPSLDAIIVTPKMWSLASEGENTVRRFIMTKCLPALQLSTRHCKMVAIFDPIRGKNACWVENAVTSFIHDASMTSLIHTISLPNTRLV